MFSSRRTHLHWVLGLLISAGAIYLSLRQIDFFALGTALQSAHYGFLLPAVLAQFSCFLLKGGSWRFLLMPAKKIPLSSATGVLIIGLMVNNLFPAKMGELARAYFMGEKERLPKSLCLSTILIEHLLDILVLLIFLLALLPVVPLPPWLRTTGLGVGLAALGMIGMIFLLINKETLFANWLNRILIRFPERFRGKFQTLATNILQGLRVVTGRYFFYALLLLAGMWSMVCVIAYCVMAAFGLSLPIQAPVMVTVFTAFGKIIPSSPGAIGTFHYLVILVLTSFSVSKEIALGYAIVLHALYFLVEVASGIAVVIAGRISLGGITRRAEEEP